MGGVLQHLQFALNQILQHLVLLDLILANNFDCTLQISLAVQCYSYLTKTALADDTTYFVPKLDVKHLLEALKILEV